MLTLSTAHRACAELLTAKRSIALDQKTAVLLPRDDNAISCAVEAQRPSRPVVISRITKRHAIAQLLFCASGCCCGRTDKQKPAVPVELLGREWRARRLNPRVQLTISECLGRCDQMNVVGILTELEPFWLGGLTETAQFETLLAWATTCHAAGTALPLPAEFDANRFARFPAAPAPSAANADSLFSPEPVS